MKEALGQQDIKTKLYAFLFSAFKSQTFPTFREFTINLKYSNSPYNTASLKSYYIL